MFTLAYVFLTWKQRASVPVKQSFSYLVRNHVLRGSVILKRPKVLNDHDSKNEECQKTENLSSFVKAQKITSFSCLDKSITGHSTKCMFIEPQVILPLTNWTCFLDSQNHTPKYICDSNTICVLLEAYIPDDTELFWSRSMSIPLNNRVDVVQYATPMAWRAGSPFGILLECTVENFIRLTEAFVNKNLVVDENLEITKFISVKVEGKPVGLLRMNSYSENINVFSTPLASKNPSATASDDECDSPDVSRLSAQRLSVALEELELEVSGESNESKDGDLQNIDNIHVKNLGIHCKPRSLLTISAFSTRMMKPPNVLIYCGKVDSVRLFNTIRSVVQQCLNYDSYTVYHLKDNQVCSSPWQENACLLVIATENLDSATLAAFLDFFNNGGSIISLCSSIEKEFLVRKLKSSSMGVLSLKYKNDTVLVDVICGKYVYESKQLMNDVTYHPIGKDANNDNTVLVHVSTPSTDKRGDIVLSQVYFDKNPSEFAISKEIFESLKQSNQNKLEILKDVLKRLEIDCHQDLKQYLKPILLMALSKEETAIFLGSVQPKLNSGKLCSPKVTLHFLDDAKNIPDSISSGYIPVLLTAAGVKAEFDMSLYRSRLKTFCLGNVVFYSDVISSTMALFDGFMFSVPNNIGVVAIAKHQLSGKGRGGNDWLSPVGCAMFSTHVRLPVRSNLGQAASYLQHIVSLAVVEAVHNIPGYEKIDLSLKWPNDIYNGKHTKVGGVIVNSTVMKDTFHAIIGCGVNIANKKPTISINDIIEQYNVDNNTCLGPIRIEEFIARTLSELEILIEGFQKYGVDWFLKAYYNVWLHGDAIVTVEKDGDFVQASIKGLDQYGYLNVQLENGLMFSVQPDGNTFDIMKNLICCRKER